MKDLIDDEEAKAKCLGTPPQFEARTVDGDLSSNHVICRNISKVDIVAELIVHGTQAMVQRQQIDTLWGQ